MTQWSWPPAMASTCPKCAQAGAGRRQAKNKRHRVISWSFNLIGQRPRRTSFMRAHPTITVCIPSLGQRSTMLLSGPSTSSDPLLSHCSAGGKWIPDRPAPASDVSRTLAIFVPSPKRSPLHNPTAKPKHFARWQHRGTSKRLYKALPDDQRAAALAIAGNLTEIWQGLPVNS